MQSNEDPTKPDTAERYLGACATSNLRFDPDRRGAPHLLIASAKASSWLGSALLRLLSEWHSTQQPNKPTEVQINALADTYLLGPPGRLQGESPEAYELRRDEYIAAAKVAEPKVRQRRLIAQREAWSWYIHELELTLGRLKTMPMVRQALVEHATAMEMPEPETVAAETLGWWLHQRCVVCDGTGQRVVHHRVRQCTKCRGSTKSHIPNGDAGRAMANFMDASVNKARAQIGTGLRKLSGRK